MFFNKKKRDNYVQNVDDTEDGWEDVINEANEFVASMKEISISGIKLEDNIWNKSTLLNMKVKQANYSGVPKEEKKSILELLLSSNKLAILSLKNENSVWTKYLIEIGNKRHEILKKEICRLCQVNGSQEIQDKIDEIEEKYYIQLMEIDPVFSKESNNKKEQIILSWILDNVPTMALLSNKEGTKKINILDNGINGSVYLNRNMKKIVLDELLSIYRNSNKKIVRFSINTWSGYHKLSVLTEDRRIHHIRKGRISSILNSKMIVPLTGKEMEIFIQQCKEEVEEKIIFFKIFLDKKDKIIEEMRKKDSDINEAQDKNNFYYTALFWNKLESELCLKKLTDKDRDLKEKMDEIDENMTKEIAKYLMKEDDVKNENGNSENEISNKIQEISIYLCENYKRAISIKIQWGKNLKGKTFEHLRKYIMKYSSCHPNEYQIWILYENFLQELGAAIIQDKIDDILNDELDNVKRLFDKYKKISKNLSLVY